MKNKKFKKISLGIIFDSVLKIPPNTGVTYRVYYLAKKLVERGVSVKIFLCNRVFRNSQDVLNFYQKEKDLEIHIIPPLIFYNYKKIIELIKINPVDIIQVENPGHIFNFGIQISRYFNIPLCLELHDIEPVLMRDLGYSHQEIKLSKKITSAAASSADKIIVFTRQDFNELVRKVKIKSQKIVIAPIGIDPRIFPYFGPNLDEKNIIFLGNMFYPPNQEALNLIAGEIYPKVLKSHKETKFIIVGMVPEEIKKKLSRPNFIFTDSTDSVDNLNDYLREGTIALCPVIRGSGMKVKILNYCAAGLPVITTTMAASGYEKLRCLIIENNIKKYPERIDRLLRFPRETRELGRKNRADVIKYYNGNKIADKIVRTLKDVLSSHSHRKLPEKDLASEIKSIPAPLWLREKRIKKTKNKTYYKVNNGKIVFKKRFN